MSVKLLDCSLRDGGHVTSSYFGRKTITGIVDNLNKSGIEYVEIGFLKDCVFDEDYAVYNRIEDVKRIIEISKSKAEYVLMVQEDQYDISKLEECDGTIKRIRVSFHCYDIDEGLEYCRKVIQKGYKCHVNPINIMGYTDEEILEILKKVNQINPDVFSIVDTFGAMTQKDLLRIYYLVDHNLNESISLGLHLHENMALSFSLAQTFIEANKLGRDIIIDGSLLGIGKAPGNLCIELIMDYINKEVGVRYNLDTVYDAIDDYIKPIRKKNKWGYSPEFALSAQFNLHRTYAEYLQSTGKLRTKDILQILGQIPNEKKVVYDSNFIEKLYKEYMDVYIDDSQTIEQLEEIFKEREILVLAPGKSLLSEYDKIQSFIDEKKPVIVSANFESNDYRTDYVFMSSLKRAKESHLHHKIIGTSNLMHGDNQIDYLINQHDYAYFNGEFCDNCVLMFINLLIKLRINQCYIAGFDGFCEQDNFFDKSMENVHANDNDMIKHILETHLSHFQLVFITKSRYNEG